MAKELPYFRFTASEWLNDDISLEDYETKGVFIDVCSFYWFKDCSIDIALLEKRFKDAKAILKQLFDLRVMTLNDDDSITIKFLDEQYDLLSEKRKKRSEAGRIGGLKKSSNAKAKPKQSSSYKDKYNNKYNNDKGDESPLTQKSKQDLLLEREAIFKKSVLENVDYDNTTLIAFFNYWSEPNKSKTKMLWETKPTFEIRRRLATWAGKSFNNTNNGSNTRTETRTEEAERRHREKFAQLGTS